MTMEKALKTVKKITYKCKYHCIIIPDEKNDNNLYIKVYNKDFRFITKLA